MRRSSLRTWLLFVSVLFAVLVIGGVALTTYVVVSDGMVAVAQDTTDRIARASSEIVTALAEDALADARRDPATSPEQVQSLAEELFMERLPVLLSPARFSESEFALYDGSLRPIWYSSERALVEGVSSKRAQALADGEMVTSRIVEGLLFEGLARPANLGVFVEHVPVVMPGERAAGVLEVSYFPTREEETIDSIRMPMFTLALAAIFAMVVLMQTSMIWVLKLVDDLRRAADSVEAGDLDVHLPEEGEHEIAELARSINRLLDRLRRRADAQTRFVADASHELATPVAGIRGYTNILRAWGADDVEVREEAIAAIDRESRRMARLCGDLLALVRDEGTLGYTNVRFDLNATCRQILAAAATRYIDKGLEFIGPEEGRLIMIGDPDRIEDAVSILVDNAGKYTAAGSVSLATRRKRDWVVIEVTDTGIGIPAGDTASIFDRFYRSDTSRSKETGGFGLGLPIAKSIVEGAGGSLDVESEPGRGSKFTIRLPRGRV